MSDMTNVTLGKQGIRYFRRDYILKNEQSFREEQYVVRDDQFM
jgi:hypothetical protein